MELTKAANAFVLVLILLSSFVIGITQGMRRRDEMFFGNGFSEINEEIAELACILCRKALIDRKDCFVFYLPEEATIDTKSTYLCEAICILPSHLKLEFLDCLRRRKLIFGFPIQGESPTCQFTKCFELLFGSSSDGRRFLAAKSDGHTEQSLVPYLVPELASISPSYSLALSNPKPTLSPSSDPQPRQFFRKKLQQKQDMDVSHPDSPLTSHARRHKSPQAYDDTENELFIAVVATVAATFCFVAALFCCWLCCRRRSNKVGLRNRQKDDSPLLHPSEFSPRYSPNSSGFGNSNFTKSGSNSRMTSSFKNNLSMKNASYGPSLVEVPSSKSTTGAFSPTPGGTAPPPSGPPPPPPPKIGRGPPAPPPKANLKPSPLGPHRKGLSDDSDFSSSGHSKTKLKPFFWDKVTAIPDHSMVWHDISSGSFQFNEDKIESLFGCNAVPRSNQRNSSEPSIQYIQIIDPKKAQNLSILLRALNVTTEEVLDALQNGTELPAELLQTLLKMAPTSEEELKLRLFMGDISQLGPADRFLKILIRIPFAFKRMESLLFMSSLQEEVSTLKESFAALEVASDKLRASRLFLKLLEAVLKTGNRMNDGTYRGGALAFKLDTLLKLSDVKGTDGKTTLLHFVIQEIIRSEGIRALRNAKASQSVCNLKSEDLVEDSNQSSEHYHNLGLKVVSGISTELEDVKKAAAVDADVLTSTVSKLKQSLLKAKAFLDSEMKTSDEDSKFYVALATFVDNANSQISWLSEEEKRIMALVQRTADYFHGNAGKNEGLHLFAIVRDFLIMLDKACKDVRDDRATMQRRSKKETPASSASLENCQQSNDSHQGLFPTIVGRQIDYSSSDDERQS